MTIGLHMKSSLAAILILCSFSLCGKDVTISAGKWNLSFDSETGNWRQLSFQNKVILKSSGGIAPFDIKIDQVQTEVRKKEFKVSLDAAELTDASLADNTDSKILNGKFYLKKYNFDIKKQTADFFFTTGTWEVVETVVFHRNQLEVKAEFVQNSTQDLKFRGFQFNFPFSLNGKYYFPGNFFTDQSWRTQNSPRPQLPDHSRRMGNIRSISPKRTLRSSRLVPIGIFEPEQNFSTTVFMDCRTDSGSIRAERNAGSLKVTCRYGACGWALAGKKQNIGTVWLQVSQKSAEKALKQDFPNLLKQLGFVRKTRPEWVYDASIYTLTLGGAFQQEKGVFNSLADKMVPRVKQLGFKVFYLYPAQTGTGRYYPYDYKKMEPNFGSLEEYKKLIAVCHQSGMRFLQDTMPQGGTPHGAAYRKDNISEMITLENGNILSFWAFDFNNPVWQSKMADVSGFYAKLGVDGFRVDAPQGGYRPNWRKAGFPAQKPKFESLSGKAQFELPKGFWERSLAEHGGKMPPLEYQRANQTLNFGGMNMVEKMREGMQREKPDGALLLETDVHPFTAIGDLNYDSEMDSVQYKLSSLEPKTFVSMLRTWLDEQQSVYAPDALFMRYIETGGRADKMNADINVGIEANKALRSLCWLTKGVPMISVGNEIGIASHIRKLNYVRDALPELRRGSADYVSLKSSDGRIFTVLRSLNNSIAAGLINFSPRHVTATVTMPENMRSAIYGKKLKDVFDNNPVTEISPGEYRISLKPWHTAVLSAKTFPEFSGKVPSFSKSAGKVKLAETGNAFTVSSADYEVEINKSNGLISSYRSKSGVECQGDLFSVNGKFPAKWEYKVTKTPLRIQALGQSEAGLYDITYSFMPDKIDCAISLPGENDNAWIFSNVEQWQIDCIDGLVHDIAFPAGVRRITPSFGGSVGRNAANDHRMLWSLAEHPLNPKSPEVRFFSGKGGMRLKFFKEMPDHADLKVTDDKKMVLRFSKEKVVFALYPTAGLRRDALPGNFLKNGVHLNCDGPEWTVSNKHYVLYLNKRNGVIKKLFTQNGKGFSPALRLQDIEATGALRRAVPYATAGSDMESKVSVTETTKGFRLRFSGQIRGLFNYAELPLFVETDYLFDSSPNIKCEITFRSLYGAPQPKLQWYAQTLPAGKNVVLKSLTGEGLLPIKIMSSGSRKSFDFFSSKDCVLPQRKYHAGFVIGTAGEPENLQTDTKVSAVKENNTDGSFEWRSTRYSLRTGKKFEFFI